MVCAKIGGFEKFSMYFHYVVLLALSLKIRIGPSFKQITLNLLHTQILFGENWPSGSLILRR